MRRVIFVLVLVMLLSLLSCSGLNISDEEKGGLFLKFGESESTKAVVRDFPDSNLFVLKISKNGGAVIYNGKYGERPADIRLEPGSYDVEVVSNLFSKPEFDMPYYVDKKSVVVQSGSTTSLSLVCKQINGGLRLIFSNGFKSHFSGYTPIVADSKGEADYVYGDTRFLYLNAGPIEIKVRSSGGSVVSVSRRDIAANEMLTLSLDAVGGVVPGAKSGIVIDTISTWVSDAFVYGQARDGSSKDRALNIGDIGERAGEKDLWVCGYIAGYLTSASLINTPPFGTETNLALAASVGASDKSKCIGVALPAGAIRSALNLKANPGNLGRRLYIKGDIVESYFGAGGVNNVKEFLLD